MKLVRVAKKIIKKIKGWNEKDLRADFEDYPEAQRSELYWLIRELEKVQRCIVVREDTEKEQG